MSKLIIVSKNHFPSLDASAIRYENLISVFDSFGYSPCLIFEYSNNDYLKRIKHENYTSVSLRKNVFKHSPLLSKIFSKIGYEKRYIKNLSSVIEKDDLVLIGGNFSLKSIRKMNAISKKIGAKSILSMTEKYSKSEFFANGFFSFEYNINKNIYRKYSLNDPPVIAISTYMANCFIEKGAKTCVIPFCFDSNRFYKNNQIQDFVPNKRISFIYCGKPSNKDLLVEMIKGFLLLEAPVLQSVELSIIGVDETWVRKRFSFEEKQLIKQFTIFYGNKNRNFISSIYQNFHFSILLRPFNKDYSKAGFPTKISESLFFGVPPITNLTSDLSFYLKDKENSIVVHGETAKDFCEAIKRALSVASNENCYLKIRQNAIITAKEKLNSALFKDELIKILN